MENGLDLAALKRMASDETQRQLALTQMVQRAVTDPYRVKTLQVCAVAYNAELGVLMIGQPDGERIDVPLTEQTRVVLRGQLAGEE